MEIPIPGAIYQHKKNKHYYIVEGCLPIKLNGEWVDNGVTIYIDTQTRDTYARLTENFMNSFIFVSED